MQFGKVSRISIFPGTSYGHLEFEDAESAKRLMADMVAENVKTLQFYGKDRMITFFYTPIHFKELRKSTNIDVPDAVFAYNNAIPGLYIYDNFISEGNHSLTLTP